MILIRSDWIRKLLCYHITIFLYEGEGLSISHPLKSDGDGHHLPLEVRKGLATTLLLDYWMTILLDSYIIIFIFLSYYIKEMALQSPTL